MEYRENGNRFANYYNWEDVKLVKYNYGKKGLIKYLMSPNIVNTQNTILHHILDFFEKNLIFLLKSVDNLKHFKNYHWKNR